jgi:carbamoyltransferase
MMHVVKIRPEKREALSAVCHEDFTGRLQTVKRSQNALYYDLIKEFSKITGTHALLNTSFNENEPIVETPEQAVACYLRNDVDALCMGSYITSKMHGKPTLS